MKGVASDNAMKIVGERKIREKMEQLFIQIWKKGASQRKLDLLPLAMTENFETYDHWWCSTK